MPRFDLVFSGELIEGCDPARVRRDLERLFRTDAASVARLFTGKPVVIKRDLDEQTAARYRAALQQVGALCRLRPAADEAAPDAVARPPSTGALAGVAILPPGSILTESRTVAPPAFDLSGISIAPPGVTLVEQGPPAADPPRPGAFDVAPAGADLAPPRSVTPAPIPDISALSMAPPQTEMLTPEERAKPAPPPPAAPDLKLAD